jgi:beta-lactamase superfamily II metal-dependent hydrolase
MSSDQVVVRMYNVGFGDCFLLTLPTTAGPRRMLIDCGTHPASTGPRQARRDAMKDLFNDLEREAGSLRIDVVVATHRHKDHISAFADPKWAEVSVGEVWMPWTEDPEDHVATEIRERMKLAVAGLLGARRGLNGLSAAGDLPQVVGARLGVASNLIDNNDEFVDDETADAFGLAIKNERSMETLWSGFAGDAKRQYLSVQEQPLESPVLPGVRIHILGPSKDESVIRDLEPPPSETFAHVDPPTSLAEAAGLPFDEGWAKSRDEFMSQADFGHLQVSGQIVGTIRQLAADDLLAAAASIESSINGTSLMLVIEVGGLFLFFPGDAQWGTWDMVLKDPRSRSLLQKAIFYKIGHHGSHNATPRTFIKEVMAANALAAIPVAPVQVWPRIPLQDLVTEMTDSKQIRLVRSDDPNAGGPIANVTVRDDISVDFVFDLPPVDGVSSEAAPRAATRRRRPAVRKTPA